MKRSSSHGTIVISGHKYQCREVDELVSDDGTKLDGWYKVTDNAILIRTGLQNPYRQSVLLHEIVHGILEHAGIEQREQIASAVAYGLMTVKINGKALIDEQG
jgi:hypothetical protein